MGVKRGGRLDSSFEGSSSADEEALLPAIAVPDDDNENGEASSIDEDRQASTDSSEGIPLIQIRTHNRTKDEEGALLCIEEPQCRICLDSGGDDMIAPCRCRGTQKYVHRTCLDNWRAAKEGFAFAHCTECRAAFYLRANMPPDRWWLRLKFQLLVVRDHAVIFIVVQLVVASLGLLVYAVYGDELREMFGYEHHPYGFYALVVVVALLVGLLYGFFIAIICGQNINNRHYHVLAKQELTKIFKSVEKSYPTFFIFYFIFHWCGVGILICKEGYVNSEEYVVENLNEDEEPPELDSGHVRELKMLGLFGP